MCSCVCVLMCVCVCAADSIKHLLFLHTPITLWCLQAVLIQKAPRCHGDAVHRAFTHTHRRRPAGGRARTASDAGSPGHAGALLAFVCSASCPASSSLRRGGGRTLPEHSLETSPPQGSRQSSRLNISSSSRPRLLIPNPLMRMIY